MTQPPPQNIAAAREEIDAIDAQVIALLERRAQCAVVIGKQKKSAAQPLYVPEREAQVLQKASVQARLLKPHIAGIYRQIIAACLSLEQPLRVAFLGPKGTFSHEAAHKLFGESMHYEPMSTITACLHETEKGNADIAIVPFENSVAGTVGETRTLLYETSLHINGEFYLRIQHHLLAVPAATTPVRDLRTIYAHPQALEQCRRWLARHAPNAHLEATPSSAAAAQTVASAKADAAVAAIGSSLSQSIYQLQPLATDIEDSTQNSTRFFVFGRRRLAPSGRDKTSLLLTTRHESGALCKILQAFSDCGINMTKLESIPSAGKLWAYLFLVDIDGHQDDFSVARALTEINQHAPFFKILGSYPKAVAEAD